jgi:hypothetical protein
MQNYIKFLSYARTYEIYRRAVIHHFAIGTRFIILLRICDSPFYCRDAIHRVRRDLQRKDTKECAYARRNLYFKKIMYICMKIVLTSYPYKYPHPVENYECQV